MSIDVGVLKDGAQIGITNEIESPKRRRFRRCQTYRGVIHSGKSRNRLIENTKESSKDFGGSGALRGRSGSRAHEKGLAEGSSEPVGLTASRQLIDGCAAIFLPGASCGDRRGAGGVRSQSFEKWTAPLDEAIQMRKVNVDLRAQIFVRRWQRAGIIGGGQIRAQSELDRASGTVLTFPAASGSMTGPVYIRVAY